MAKLTPEQQALHDELKPPDYWPQEMKDEWELDFEFFVGDKWPN